MSRRQISIDNDVFVELQRRAEPLVDDANSVLRRVFGLDSDKSHQSQDPQSALPRARPPTREPRDLVTKSKARHAVSSAPQASRVKPNAPPGRAPKGSLLPEAEYNLPLLEALVELGGSAHVSKVTELVGRKLDGRLTERDQMTIKSGDIRWKNRLQFVRLGLIKQGLMAQNSPRGIWEVTESGQRMVNTNSKGANR